MPRKKGGLSLTWTLTDSAAERKARSYDNMSHPELLRTGGPFSWPLRKMPLSRIIAQGPRLSRFGGVSLVN